jgi:MFS family permease
MSTHSPSPGRSALPIILLTVFITMIGFGIVIPVLPVYAKSEFHLSPSQMGWLVGIFSLVLLVASPVFGKISDRIGRKPVLLISIIGTSLGFFILGSYSHQLPFYFAAGLSVLTAVLVVAILPETLTAERRLHPAEPAPLAEVFAGGRTSFILLLLAATLISTTGFAFIHVLFALFCVDHFGWTVKQTSYAFAYIGFIAVLVQGGLLRRLLTRNIEKELALTGAVILAAALFLLPRSGSVGQFLGVSALLALGNGLLVPTLSGMSSRHVHGRAQGRVLGLMAAAGSLGRWLGPAIAVLPLPAGFSEGAHTGTDLVAVNHSYVVAFSWSAGLVLLSALCLLFLRVPNDVPEEGVVMTAV